MHLRWWWSDALARRRRHGCCARVSPGRSSRRGRWRSCVGGRWRGSPSWFPPIADVGPRRARDGRGPPRGESPGAFEAVVGNTAGHPLLSAHAARRRPALRLSDAVEPRRLHHNELYADLLHPPGVEYCITIVVRTERREIVVAGSVALSVSSPSATATCSISCAPPSRARCEMPRRASGSSPARHQPAAAHRRRAARPLRRDRAFEPRRRSLGGRALRGRPSTGLAARAGRRRRLPCAARERLDIGHTGGRSRAGGRSLREALANSTNWTIAFTQARMRAGPLSRRIRRAIVERSLALSY